MKNIIVGEYEWKFMVALSWLSATFGALTTLVFSGLAILLVISIVAMPYVFSLIIPLFLAAGYTAYCAFVSYGLSERKGSAVAHFGALCVVNVLAGFSFSEWSDARNFVTVTIDVLAVLYLAACVYLVIRWWPFISSLGREVS